MFEDNPYATSLGVIAIVFIAIIIFVLVLLSLIVPSEIIEKMLGIEKETPQETTCG